jgi:hypothetical protein
MIGSVTLKSFIVLANVNGSPGETRSFNANRQVIVKLTFSDNSQAIARIDVP